MQINEKTYKELNDIFDFDLNPLEKFKTLEKAQNALNMKKGGWGKSNLIIPNDNISGWFGLAVDALKKGKRTVIMNTFNPHYKYWFKYVWPWASKVLIYKKHVITFKGYDNPCPKTVVLILFDPEQRKKPRTNLIKSYVDNKYPYFTLPLKIKKVK